jgi:hypothetical protein
MNNNLEQSSQHLDTSLEGEISTDLESTKDQVIDQKEGELEDKVDALGSVESVSLSPLAQGIQDILTVDPISLGSYKQLVSSILNPTATPSSIEATFLKIKNQLLTQLMEFQSIQNLMPEEDMVKTLERAIFELPALSQALTSYISYPLQHYALTHQQIRNTLHKNQQRKKHLTQADISSFSD